MIYTKNGNAATHSYVMVDGQPLPIHTTHFSYGDREICGFTAIATGIHFPYAPHVSARTMDGIVRAAAAFAQSGSDSDIWE